MKQHKTIMYTKVYSSSVCLLETEGERPERDTHKSFLSFSLALFFCQQNIQTMYFDIRSWARRHLRRTYYYWLQASQCAARWRWAKDLFRNGQNIFPFLANFHDNSFWRMSKLRAWPWKILKSIPFIYQFYSMMNTLVNS